MLSTALSGFAFSSHAVSFQSFAFTDMAVDIPGESLEIQRVRPLNSLSFEAAPVINASGDIAFWSGLKQQSNGATFGDAIWSYRQGVLAPVAVAGDALPGVSGATYDAFLGRRIIIDGDGNVAYGAQVDLDTGGTIRALGVGGQTAPRIAVIEGQTVPQVDPLSPAFGFEFETIGFGINFLNPYSGDEYVFNGNNLAFHARIGDPDSNATFVPALYVERPRGLMPTELELMARSGADTSFIPSSEVGAISRSGEGFFRTFIKANDSDPSFSALVSYTADISIVARTGTDSGTGAFGSLNQNAGFNQNAQSAFAARFSGLADSDSGIFKSNDPDGTVVTEGIIAAGTPDLSGDGVPDFVFHDFISVEPLLNANGNVLFKHFARTPDGSMTKTGIWSDRTGSLTGLDLIAMEDEQAVGLEEGATYENIAPGGASDLVINGNDDIAFVAQVRRADNSLDWGLWAERNGELELIVVTGQSITLPDGTTFDVTAIDFAGGSGNQDGRPSGFSDNGQIVFRADGIGTTFSALFQTGLAIPGDANNDGAVNLIDLDILGQNWMQNAGGAGGDFNGDGIVNLIDLDILGQNWLTETSFESAVAASGIAVPEPGSIAALLSGLMLLNTRRSRRP